MLIAAQWTLSWGTVALMNATDLMDDESRSSGSGRYDVVAPIRGQFTIRNPRGLVTNQRSFKRVVVFDTPTGNFEALLFREKHEDDLNRLSAASNVAAPDCKLTQLLPGGLTGGVWLLKNASCKWNITVEANRVVCDYQLEYGQRINTVPGVDPAAGAPPVPLTDEDGIGITDESGTAIGTH